MKKAAKYIGLGLASLVVLFSLAYNGTHFYKAYADSLRAEGYSTALKLIDASLTQNGRLDITRTLPDGTTEQVVLVPQKQESAKEKQK